MVTGNSTGKAAGPTKSFMTVGPTLHYSHSNVRHCWGLAVAVFLATCLFWSKILTGDMFVFDLSVVLDKTLWHLGQYAASPLSIYEYPWQISVLGLLMGIMGVGPVIVSQLLSFRYSVPMILLVVFVAKLPLFGLILLISCVAVACRPLRFRSRFIAIVLCMAPQIAYWAIFGGGNTIDPLSWGFSFAPWVYAWLAGSSIAAVVLGIGHFTRYRPGLVWVVTGLAMLASVVIFQTKISFAELDYQLYIAGNNPEEVRQFHNNDFADLIDTLLEDPATREILHRRFFPTESIPLRKELKEDIATHMAYGSWPYWFNIPDELKYQRKKRQLLTQYDNFIDNHPTSRRMPVALYYKAVLEEYSPDVRYFELHEVLRFYGDYPHKRNLSIWEKLFNEFPQSDESLEARWRIAMHLAGGQKFDKAKSFCEFTKARLIKRLGQIAGAPSDSDAVLAVFTKGSSLVITAFKLQNLRQKLNRLELLLANAETMKTPDARERLGRFIMLNPHGRDYSMQIDKLLDETTEADPLKDDLLLAKIKLIPDVQLRGRQLQELSNQYSQTDAGTEALYELGVLNVQLWKNPEIPPEDKAVYLRDARRILTNFTKEHPDSFFGIEAGTMLKSFPIAEQR